MFSKLTEGLTQPEPEKVGEYYDKMTVFYELVGWGENVHGGIWPVDGFWPDGTPCEEGENDLSLQRAQEALTNLVMKYLLAEEEDHVLDVGCGIGGPAVRLAQTTGCEVTGISISQKQIDKANELATQNGVGGQAHFEYSNAMELAFMPGTFDKAMVFEAIFHMPSRVEVLKQINVALRPGGRLVLTDSTLSPNATQMEKLMIGKAFEAYSLIEKDSFEEVQVFYQEILEEAGFELEVVLDLTPNIRNTIRETKKALDDDNVKEAIVEEYGKPFLITMNAFWNKLADIYEEHMGYVLVSAVKPEIAD